MCSGLSFTKHIQNKVVFLTEICITLSHYRLIRKLTFIYSFLKPVIIGMLIQLYINMNTIADYELLGLFSIYPDQTSFISFHYKLEQIYQHGSAFCILAAFKEIAVFFEDIVSGFGHARSDNL